MPVVPGGCRGNLGFVKVRHVLTRVDASEPALVEFHDIVYCEVPGAHVCAFRFKAAQPTFDGPAFGVYGEPAADGRSVHLWARDHAGGLTMDATAELA